MAEGDGRQVEWLQELTTTLRGVHDAIIEISGGVLGEHPSFLGACARPFQSVLGEDAYPTPFEKAAALFHAIICDHAFVDGNKRTGTVGAIMLLIAMGALPSQANALQIRLLGNVALEAASTGLSVQDIAFWMHRIFDEREQHR